MDHGDLDSGSRGGRGKNWLEFECIWKGQLTRFAGRLDVGCKRMRAGEGETQGFVPEQCRTELPCTEVVKPGRGKGIVCF